MPIALAFGLGIVAGDMVPFSASALIAAILVSCCCWVLCVLVSRIRFRSTPDGILTVLALVVVSLSGALAETVIHHVASNEIANLTASFGRDDERELAMTGVVSSFVASDSTKVRFDFRPVLAHGRRHVIRVSGALRVTVRDGCRSLQRGMRVGLRGSVYRPARAYNPADFNYREFLRRKGIRSMMYVKKESDCIIMDGRGDRIASLRNWFRESIRSVVPAAARPLPTALIIGDRTNLAPDTRQAFAESGLMHLLAISGLHVLFVGLSFYALIRSMLARFDVRWRVTETASTASTLLLLMVYALITGATPSVFRASLMAAVFLSSRPLFRSPNSANSLGFAALVVLMFDPDSLFTAGFQLSFCAVLGLITAGRTTSAWASSVRQPVVRWSLGLLGASMVATLATAPVTTAQFGYVPLAGLLMNLTAIPTASALLVSSILSAGLSPISVGFASNIGSAAELLSELLNLQARIGSLTSGWTLIRPPPRLLWLGVPVILTLALLPNISRRARLALLIISIALPGADQLVQAVGGSFKPKLDVMFLDVGHGDAALIILPNRKTVLIDAGNRTRTWDYGERVIIPHLHHLGIEKLDAVIVSHPHGDHFGGLPSILRQISAECVYDNGKETNTQLFSEYRKLIEERVPCYKVLEAGDRISLDEYVSILVLAPPEDYENEGQNDESVVVKLIFGRSSFLFTGDVEHDAESLLVIEQCSMLKSDVVKVAHHGSRTSSTSAFVRCASPSFAVISVGRPDKFGLPDEEIPIRWEKAGSRVLSTRASGFIRFVSNGYSVRKIPKSTLPSSFE